MIEANLKKHESKSCSIIKHSWPRAVPSPLSPLTENNVKILHHPPNENHNNTNKASKQTNKQRKGKKKPFFFKSWKLAEISLVIY